MEKSTACWFCDSAYTNPELQSDNDLSYMSIGECSRGYRLLFRSGSSRPTEILVEQWNEKAGWHSIGYYWPRYCPNCGRELKENKEAIQKFQQKMQEIRKSSASFSDGLTEPAAE